MTTTNRRSAAFTLIEILIVLGIIIVLFAILLPAVSNVQRAWRNYRTKIDIENLALHIERYNTEKRGYPPTELGLYVLLYIPDNEGMIPAQITPGIPGGGMPDAMQGGSGGVGPELLDQPNPMFLQTGQPGMPSIDSLTNQPAADPMSGGSGIAGGTMTGQPLTYTSNLQMFMQKRKRSTPYGIENEKQLLDFWGNPYRYDNTRAYYGLNRTGSEKPAIWSAGPDGDDGTDDDIRNWDPAQAAEDIQAHQMQLQRQGSGMGDPYNMGTGGQMSTDPYAQPGTQPFGPGQTMPMGPGTQPMGPGTQPMGPGTQPFGPGTQPIGPPGPGM